MLINISKEFIKFSKKILGNQFFLKPYVRVDIITKPKIYLYIELILIINEINYFKLLFNNNGMDKFFVKYVNLLYSTTTTIIEKTTSTINFWSNKPKQINCKDNLCFFNVIVQIL